MRNERANIYLAQVNRVEDNTPLIEDEFDQLAASGDEFRALNEAIDALNTAKVALLDAVKAAVVAEIEES